MAYDEALANRVRTALALRKGVVEKKMFGGLAYMVHGNMACGVVKDDLMVRVGPDKYDELLTEPHARPMDFTGRPLRGMIYVGPKGHGNDKALALWVRRGVDFANSLPAK